MPPDVFQQPDAPDVVLDDDDVLSISRRHGLALRAVTGIDESGGEARVYFIDDGYVVKTQRPNRVRARTSLEKEAFFLTQLQGQLGVSLPTVIGHGRAGDVEYTIMTRVPGVAVRQREMRPSSRARLLWDLGHQLRVIHELSLSPLVKSGLFPGVRTAAEFHDRLRAGFAAAAETIEGQGIDWRLPFTPSELAERTLAELPPTVALAPLHSNPGPEHVFVDPETEEFSGLIDFGDAYVGHPGFDWRWPALEDRLVMLSGYSEGGALGADFLSAWRASVILSDMAAVANRPERREVASEALDELSRLDIAALRDAIVG